MSNSKSLEAKTLLFKEGAKANTLYLVKKGEVICLKAAKDRLIPVFMAKENDIVGESAMVPDLTYTYSAIAYTKVELIEIPASNFKEVFNLSPDWLLSLTTTMISRFQSTANLVAENRLIHPLIINEDKFPSTLEVEYKRIIN